MKVINACTCTVHLQTDPINVCDNVIFEAVQNPTLLSSTVFFLLFALGNDFIVQWSDVVLHDNPHGNKH